jgi:hypothetical protein
MISINLLQRLANMLSSDKMGSQENIDPLDDINVKRKL